MTKKRFLLFIVLSALFAVLVGIATAQSDSATYNVTFTATWSDDTHPHPGGTFPASAHFSGLIGAIHNENVSFWEAGESASAGIELMAETGRKADLREEVNAAITAGTAITLISEAGSDSPDTLTFTVDVDTANPLITIVTMVAPSPDWFAGVSGLSLRSGNDWVPSLTVDLFPYDAGTEDGDDYTLSNPETDPRGTIESVTNVSPFSAEPVGTFMFELAAEPTSVTLQNGSGYAPNTLLLLLVLPLLGAITSAAIIKR